MDTEKLSKLIKKREKKYLQDFSLLSYDERKKKLMDIQSLKITYLFENQRSYLIDSCETITDIICEKRLNVCDLIKDIEDELDACIICLDELEELIKKECEVHNNNLEQLKIIETLERYLK